MTTKNKLKSIILNNKKLVTVISISLITISVFITILQTTNALPRSTDRVQVLTPIGNLEVGITDKDTIDNIKLGSEASRQIVVENKGDVPVFVRIMIFPTLKTSENLVTPLTNDDILKDLTTTDWVDGGDGYFYYKKVLGAGDESSKIFSKITVPSSKNEGKMELSVKVESTISSGNEYRQAFWGSNVEPNNQMLKDIDSTLQKLNK